MLSINTFIEENHIDDIVYGLLAGTIVMMFLYVVFTNENNIHKPNP
jgi:hypothetical protein